MVQKKYTVYLYNEENLATSFWPKRLRMAYFKLEIVSQFVTQHIDVCTSWPDCYHTHTVINVINGLFILSHIKLPLFTILYHLSQQHHHKSIQHMQLSTSHHHRLSLWRWRSRSRERSRSLLRLLSLLAGCDVLRKKSSTSRSYWNENKINLIDFKDNTQFFLNQQVQFVVNIKQQNPCEIRQLKWCFMPF